MSKNANTKMKSQDTLRYKMPYERKKGLIGFIFLSPWLIGLVGIFFYPLMDSLRISFTTMSYQETQVVFVYNNFANYMSFLSRPDFVRNMTTSIQNMIYQVPVIVIFSLFIAIILNQKFRMRVAVRTIFFLPVIIASGVVISIIRGDEINQAMNQAGNANRLFQATFLTELMRESGISYDIVNIITTVVNSMFELLWKSGIQILIFLAGLQTIHPSQYEAAKIEGATGWEVFWKITFPIISPITIMNIIYTIIATFRDYSNVVINEVANLSKKVLIEQALALSWTYFIIIAFIIAVVYAIINRFVFYQV